MYSNFKQVSKSSAQVTNRAKHCDPLFAKSFGEQVSQGDGVWTDELSIGCFSIPY
jgi:hypothetical protein